jgi:type II secretory pathway pseudopilin PulG
MLNKNTVFKKPTNLKIEAVQGFTLVESLMGILVITVVAIAITPPIVLSTATRVQNRRAEQAMQLAQAETDRVRVFVEQGGTYTAKLPPVLSGTITSGNIAAVAAPTTFVATRALANSSTKAFGVDVDKDNKVDFYVQTFRDNDTNAIVTGTTSTLVAFQMGVRVYSKVAKAGSLQTQSASLRLTTSSGGQEFKPLAVAYTTVARSDAKISLEKYKQYLSP